MQDSSRKSLPEYWDGQVSQALATPITVSQVLTDSELFIELADSGRITGTVTDIEGRGLTDVRVRVWSDTGSSIFSVTTDDGGFYELWGLDTGSYRVQFDSTGIHADEFYSDAGTLQTATPISVVHGQATTTSTPSWNGSARSPAPSWTRMANRSRGSP